jgi:hypothetical protein
MPEKPIQSWRDQLNSLLEQARTAGQAGTFEERQAVAVELRTFIGETPPTVPDLPETAEFEEMDKIALGAHRALMLGAAEERVAAIMANTAELAGLAKKVQAQTAANEQAARSIRLEKARKVVVASTDAIAAITELKTQIEAQTGAEGQVAVLGEKLGKALAALRDLRQTVESTG